MQMPPQFSVKSNGVLGEMPQLQAKFSATTEASIVRYSLLDYSTRTAIRSMISTSVAEKRAEEVFSGHLTNLEGP